MKGYFAILSTTAVDTPLFVFRDRTYLIRQRYNPLQALLGPRFKSHAFALGRLQLPQSAGSRWITPDAWVAGRALCTKLISVPTHKFWPKCSF